MEASPLMDPLAWLFTFALHSTILLGGALLVGRRLGRNRANESEALYRWALLGALITPTLQLGLGLQPFGGHITLPAARQDAAVTVDLERPTTPEPADATLTVEELELLALRRELALTRMEPNELVLAPVELPSYGTLLTATPTTGGTDWRRALLAGWAAVAAIGSLLLVARLRRVRQLLRRGEPVHELQRELDVLCERAGMRRSPAIVLSPDGIGPLTAGITRPRIVLPVRALTELSSEQRAATLAHELAHVERRDTLSSLLLSALEAVFWFQPLLRLVHRRLEDCAEWLADDRAVDWTDDPIQLARSLTTVASWSLASPRLASAMVARHSRLEERVGRLLRRRASRPHRGRVAIGAALALGTIAGVAPAVVSSELEPLAEVDVWVGAEGKDTETPEAPERLFVVAEAREASSDTLEPGVRESDDVAAPARVARPGTRATHPLLVDLDFELAALRLEAEALTAEAQELGLASEVASILEQIEAHLRRLTRMRVLAGELLEASLARSTRTTRAPGATSPAPKTTPEGN